jgi:hypothetical protein
MDKTPVKLTAARSAAIAALRGEADNHNDTATVALCDAALAGDADAAGELAAQIRSTATRRKERAPARLRRPLCGPRVAHPWTHDED